MAVGNFRGLDFLRTATDVLGRFGITLFDGIDQIRNIDFAKGYLWAVRFIEPAPPSPFTNYFPASNIEIGEISLDSYNFESGQSAYRIPERSGVKTVTITFYDDENFTLQRWMSDWVNIDILNRGQYMSCLLDGHPVEGGRESRTVNFLGDGIVWPTRKIEFFRLGRDLEPVPNTEKTLLIYPEGELSLSATSSSEALQFTLTFVIVGDAAKPAKKKSGNDFIERSKREATRLLGRFT
jgi:hypothetical protein